MVFGKIGFQRETYRFARRAHVRGISDGSLHVYTDLPTIVAGHGGGAIPTNRHLRSKGGTPIANLWLAMAQLMGVQTNRIADSTGVMKLG